MNKYYWCSVYVGLKACFDFKFRFAVQKPQISQSEGCNLVQKAMRIMRFSPSRVRETPVQGHGGRVVAPAHPPTRAFARHNGVRRVVQADVGPAG